jgi:hypothetical protein
MFGDHSLECVSLRPISSDDEVCFWEVRADLGYDINEEINSFSVSKTIDDDYVDFVPGELLGRVGLELCRVDGVWND